MNFNVCMDFFSDPKYFKNFFGPQKFLNFKIKTGRACKKVALYKTLQTSNTQMIHNSQVIIKFFAKIIESSYKIFGVKTNLKCYN